MDHARPPAGVHPRILRRLEVTLLRRLRSFEIERGKTRRILEEILSRIVRLEDEFGVTLAGCRFECDQALSEIDALDARSSGAEAGLEPLLQRIVQIVSSLNDLDLAVADGRSAAQ